MASRVGILLMRVLALLPLSWVRVLGWVLGWVLYAVVGSRRRVARTNLDQCFPQWSDAACTSPAPCRSSRGRRRS
jgi:KDO2-lipid IV(A) lauroyltransferase